MSAFNYCHTTLPQNNFYGYVNNRWKNENPIPNEHTRWCTFTILNEQSLIKIKNIIETSSDKRCNILYKQGCDEQARNIFSELYKYINKILRTNNIASLLRCIVLYHMTICIKSPFSFFVYNDYNAIDMNILHIGMDGLGMPDRDYYYNNSMEETRTKYKEFLSKLFKHCKLPLNTNTIFNIEMQLAQYTYTNVQKRNPELRNNPMTVYETINKYPFLKCLVYFFDNLKIKNYNTKKVNITNPKYFEHLNNLFNTIPLMEWKEYFISRLLLSNINYLSVDIEKISFDFYGTFLNGIKEIKPLWKRSINTTENQLGELIGKAYVMKYFSENAKNKVLNMVKYIKKTLEYKIKNLTWMSNVTKEKALDKLNAMEVKIGYPDEWRKYTRNVKNKYSYFVNNMNCNINNNMYEFTQLYKPVNKKEFEMNPHKVNAYYSPTKNEIVFPAGILQPPFFSEHFDDALNFGAIGAVIGHEITHGFDDMGCKYDKNGMLKNWWTDEDLNNYNTMTEKIKIQYDKCIINDKNVNGMLTLGENIADIGGVSIALSSYLSYAKENNIKEDLNKFFSSYATIWRSNCTKEYIDMQLLTDPHSPSEFRVNCVLSNIAEFNKYYNITNEHNMYNDNITVIW